VTIHRRRCLTAQDRRVHFGIPATSPVRTLADIATALSARQLEVAVNEADKLDLIDPEALRHALDEMVGQPGVPALRKLLDRLTFVLTDSELERYFLPIARRAGLSMPETGRWLNGFEVDFFWPELGLVVETDGLRYHRTPAEQARDRLRDQAHTAAGLTPLRFTHAQVRFEPDYVCMTLGLVAERLRPQLQL
jgi:very-short-patch-repair endonuclease